MKKMVKKNNSRSIGASKHNEIDPVQVLQIFEDGILKNIDSYGLPTNNILVPLSERIVVFQNVGAVLQKIPETHVPCAIYFSKFLAAVSVGLFDAALNYLWDETIIEIRKRAIQYDVKYFYDAVKVSEEKRNKLKSPNDITFLDDAELISGALNMGLISELGYRHLDFIRYMRNWASAAHPNQNELTGLQLISWMETCIKEVISLPLSDVVIQIKNILTNIKSNNLTEDEAKQITFYFAHLNQQQVNNLMLGFIGIYLDSEVSVSIKQNIKYLAPTLWTRINEESRQNISTKYGNLIANGETTGASKLKEFLEMVGGLSCIPDEFKIFDIEQAVQNLVIAHNTYNNFYSEPLFARQVQDILGSTGKIPDKIRINTVHGIVSVFLSNGHGIANGAEPIYVEIIKNFDQKDALVALLSFTNDGISSKLQFKLCQSKYRELLGLIRDKFTAPSIIELFEKVNTFPGNLDRMKYDVSLKKMCESVEIILQS